MTAPRVAPGLTADASDPRRWWTLGVLCLSLLIVSIDTSILNVALATLVRELEASTSELQWIVDAYIVVVAGLLLVMGNLGDRLGRKKVLNLGLVIFGVASAFGAFTTSPTQLILARALMGVGASMILPATLSILANVFTEARERRRAIAYWSLMNAAGTTIGPITGGLLLRHFWWGSVFLVNVPVVVVALLVGWKLVPDSRNPRPGRLDVAGAALSIVGLSGLLYAIIMGGAHGWTDPYVVTSYVVTVVAVTSFVWWELHTTAPMLNLRYFRDPRITASSVATIIGFSAMTGTMFLLSQLLQLGKGYSPLSAALHISLPLAVVNFVVMPLNPRLVERFGPKRLVAAGLFSATAGLVCISLTQVDSGYANLLVGLSFLALGFSLFVPAVTDAIMGVLPLSEAGSGSAINQTTRQVGQALGVALAGTLAAQGFRRALVHDSADLGLPASLVEQAKTSVADALRVAEGITGPVRDAFVDVVQRAFVDGIRVAVIAAAVVAFLGALFALVAVPSHLPSHAAPVEGDGHGEPGAGDGEVGDGVGVDPDPVDVALH